MTLPIAVSVPHAGLTIPERLTEFCKLSRDEVIADSDEQAAEIYDIAEEVEALHTIDVARAIVDMNRDPEDLRPDGVVKTETSYQVPVWSEPPSEKLIQELIARYHRPYHRRLSGFAKLGVKASLDCHTMAEVGPPPGPGAGEPRPEICISYGEPDSPTMPEAWVSALAESFEAAFGLTPSINSPFQGGYITRHHSTEMPWVQIELNRGNFLSPPKKRQKLLKALTHWCERLDAL